MAGPMAGVQQAQQIAQQQQMQKPEATPKTGQSKFDQAMAHKADQAQATNQVNQVQQTQAAQATQKTAHVDGVHKAGKPTEVDKARAVKHNDPVDKKHAADKPGHAIETVLTEMEGRNAAMDKFVNQAMSGKIKLNQQQLLGLQAKVAQYSLELDLTGKVVEKATNGLKDTLRTQV